MSPEVIRADVKYQKNLLDELMKEISAQSFTFNKLLDDFISRRGPRVVLKLPEGYQLKTNEIAVKYNGIKLKGETEYGNYESPELNIEGRGVIHMYGAGRTGLEVRSWAMRLIHMGFDVSEPGSITAKRVRPGDLGIFCSGGWKTLSTTNYARATKKAGATTVGITSYPELVKDDCDYCIEIGGREKMGEIRDYYVESLKGKSSTTLDILGTVFEFKLAAFKDLFIHRLGDTLGEVEEKMEERHVKFE